MPTEPTLSTEVEFWLLPCNSTLPAVAAAEPTGRWYAASVGTLSTTVDCWLVTAVAPAESTISCYSASEGTLSTTVAAEPKGS